MRSTKKAWYSVRKGVSWIWRQSSRAARAVGLVLLGMYLTISARVSAAAGQAKETVEAVLWQARYKISRTQNEKRATEELERQMTGRVPENEDQPELPQGTEANAKLETAKAAESAAENAPLGAMSEEEAREALYDAGSVSQVIGDAFSMEKAPEPVGRGPKKDHIGALFNPFTDENGDSVFDDATGRVSVSQAEEDIADALTDRTVSSANVLSEDEQSLIDAASIEDTELADRLAEEDLEDVVQEPRGTRTRKTDLKAYGYWETNPNAADEIQEAAQFPLIESQIRETVIHLLTSEPSIAGPEKYADIIRKWFEVEMEYASGHRLGIYEFISDIASQMLRYGSAPILKQRTYSQSRNTYTDPVTGGTRLPVWGYRIPDSATVQVFVDKQGRPRKVRQSPVLSPDDDPTTYSIRDAHFASLPFRNSAMYFWTPSLVTPVLYAVKVLQDLHETIERHTKNIIDIPSYAKVGDKNYVDGKTTPSMIEDVAKTIRTTNPNDLIVFPWHVDLEKHESDEYVEQLVEAGRYWEKVVRRGIGQTKLTDGESLGASQNAADTFAEKGMRFAQALVPAIQKAARWLFIDRLLEEPGITLSDFDSHDDMPTLEFEDINRQQQQARESHIVFLWQNDLITHKEARNRLGRDPDDTRAEKYFSDIQGELKNDGQSQSRTRPGGNPKPRRKASE